MRLLYLCFERIRHGSAAATHVGEICKGLERRGFAVRLIARTGRGRNGPLAQAGRYLGITLAGLAALPRTDAIYVRSHFAALPLALVARMLGRPVVHEINGTYADALVTHPVYARAARLLGWMQRTQYRLASALIAVTPDLAAWGRQQAGQPAGPAGGRDRVFFVANAANTTLFRPDGDRTARPRPYVLFFGGLTRWHGVDTMLAAARDPAWPAGIELVIAGPIVDPSLAPALRALPPGIVHLGPVKQDDLPALIRGAVAALVPISDPGGRSSKGVLPLKLYEALACGVPAIVTDLPGQADLVREGGCGVVVPVDDPGALAQAVAGLARDPERARALGAAGARLVHAAHSWDARAADTAAILRDLTTSR
ncbi:MAG: glycosyltransferase WbuB [Enterovirga sp.]|nr:glycosyltransferase WbuB [Enterovirga sp.]